MRIRDPLKQWKLSPMDLESRRRWEVYTKAKEEEMLERTHIPEARWWVVEGVDKKKNWAQLHQPSVAVAVWRCRTHPNRIAGTRAQADYVRQPLSKEMYVPAIY
jgi:hypothetical protein